MKNIILNNVKKSLSVTLALALLAISLFTGVSLNIKAAETQENIIYWDGTSEAPTKTDDSGNVIIENVAQLHYIAIKAGTTETTGKSYKIADGIDVMIMQPQGTVDVETLMGLTDYNAVKTYLTETVTEPKNWLTGVSDSVRFNGSFDGNGVQIYGMYATGSSVGLFPCGDGGTAYTTEGHTGCVYQNFAVRNSYFESTRRLGVISAYCASGIGIGTVTAKNCEVSNCYMISTATTASYFVEAGVLIGRTTNELVKVDNCLVYGNYNYATGLDKQIPLYPCAYTGDSNALNKVENTVVLGTTPYPTNGTSSKTHGVNCFENVYTDQDLPTYTTYADTDMKKVALDDIKGTSAQTNMPGLDWTNTWTVVDGDYPKLKLFYKEPAVDDGGDSGDNEEETLNIVYWDGTKKAPDETNVDSEGNILITTAAELNYIATTASSGKSYKIADGIDVMILQPESSVDAETLMGLTDYNAVKTYLTETITPTPWLSAANTNDPAKVICNFDGNGVRIYGLYAVNSNSAGLFPGIDGDSVFQNFALRNSYIESARRIGVLGAYCAGSTVGTVSAKCVEISNCYITDSSTTETNFNEMGVLFGRTTKDYVKVENCLIYDNYSYAEGLNKVIPLYAGTATGTISTVENSVVLGLTPYPTYSGAANSYNSGVDSFENVYTDQDLPTVATYADTDIKKVALDDIKGTAAQTNMSGLDWENIWISVNDNYPQLRIFYESSSSGGSGEGGGSGEEPEQPEDPEIPEDIQDCAQNIIYWDNTKTDSSLADKGEKGTADDPIIIDSAEELNYLALYTNPNTTTEKHYKIADNIDAIILQPEAVVAALGGAGKIMNLTSAAAVNTYFTDMQSAGYTPANWITTNIGNQFNGSFDGNGIKIYGMYAVATAGTNSAEAAALFPVIDAGGSAANTEVETDFVGVIYKDIAIRNSYISSTRRIGALAACSYGTNYGGKVNGTINVEGIEVSNCYIRSTSTTEMETGLLLGTTATDLVNINNCLVYGNNTSWNKSGTVRSIPFVGASAKIAYGNNEVYENTLTNSIILGVVPSPQNDEAQFNGADNIEKVYTDADFSTLATKYSYTDSDMIKLSGTTDAEKGVEIGDGLNFTGNWIAAEGGMPTLYAFHDAIEVVSSDNTTHSIKCGCGIASGTVSHVYDYNYKCVQCNYQHNHTMVDNGVQSDADCVNGGVMNTVCTSCGFESTREIVSGGHQFSAVVAATEGDCKTEATVAYKTCSVCEFHFAEDADIHSSEPLDYIGTGYTGRHNWVEQGVITSECSGVQSAPYYKCSVCDTYLVDGVMCETEPSEIDGHTATGNYYIDKNTHANTCVTCGEVFDAQEHTDANQDSICDVCKWPCGEHIFDGASITLTDSIAVNYMIRQSVIDALGYENLYIDFTFCGKDYRVSNYTETTIDGVAYYVFTFDKMAPDRMAEIIYATLCGTKDGAKYTSQTSEYSIKLYCHNMLAKSTDQDGELRTLLVDILNYGAESQLYSGYNIDNLANAALTDEQLAWGTQGDVTTESDQNLKYKVIENPTVKWRGAGLYLDEETTLRFTIQTDNIRNLVVKVNCGKKTIEIPASRFARRTDAGNGDMYYVYVRGITAIQMREPIYLTVYNGDTQVSNTISYSVQSYANARIGGSDTKLSNLLVAMIKYGDAAKAYANKQ